MLGPILFSIYTNDLLNLDFDSKILAFADDIVLIFEGDNWNDMKRKAHLGLSQVSKWYINNSLMLNKSKLVVIFFMLFSLNTSEQIIIKLRNNKCKESEKKQYLANFIVYCNV